MRKCLPFSAMLLCMSAFAAYGQAPAGATFQKDVVYGHAEGVDLKLDLGKPPAGGPPVPALVFIHGGAWQVGSKDTFEPLVRQFADNGYVTASVEYRLAPAHKWPAQIEDVKCAVRYLRAHAKELNIIPDKIGAAGDSAGGHLSLLLGLMDPKDGLEGTGGNPEQSSKVQAVVNFYGPTDMRVWHATAEAEAIALQSSGKGFETMLVDLLGTSDRNAPVMVQMSPVNYINKGDPPILTFHGTKDRVVPFDQAKILHAALEKEGVPQTLVPEEGADHGLDPFIFATALVQGTQFLDLHLKGKKPDTTESAKPAKP